MARFVLAGVQLAFAIVTAIEAVVIAIDSTYKERA